MIEHRNYVRAGCPVAGAPPNDDPAQGMGEPMEEGNEERGSAGGGAKSQEGERRTDEVSTGESVPGVETREEDRESEQRGRAGRSP